MTTAPAKVYRGRMLIVEDHGPTRRGLARSFHQRGWEVVAVDSVVAAREYYVQPFEALVCDWRLPDAEGSEVIGAMARNHTAGTIVLHTGDTGPHITKFCKENPSVWLVPKGADAIREMGAILEREGD